MGATLVLACLLAASCAECERIDVDAYARDWQRLLDANLKPGASPQQVLAYLASREVEGMHQPDQRRVWSMTRLREPDSRWRCGIVATTLQTDCRFDSNDRLLGCTTSASHTGP